MEEREDQSDGDKSEEPTDERRRQFREQGNIANPREVVGAIALTLFTLIFSFGGQRLFRDISLVFHRAWLGMKPWPSGGTPMGKHVYATIEPLIPWLVGTTVVLVSLPVAVGLLFTRFNWAWKKLELNLEKLSMTQGLKRVFGIEIFVEGGKTLVKAIALIAVITLVIRSEVLQAPRGMLMPIQSLSVVWGGAALKLLIAVVLTSFVLGLLDFGLNWWRIERQMRMTKQEVKQEYKSQEGDPLFKSARRRMGREIAMRKSVAQVQHATFIVTNPEHFAVAIRYVAGMNAPLVVAKGQDFLALKIREIAKGFDIPIVENKPLARTLYKTVKIGAEVPPSLYASVIEVMKYIYQTRGRDYFERHVPLRNGA